MKTTKAGYRDQDAVDNQEVTTPKFLVDRIYSFLSPKDLSGDILDPCVGPGALVTPLLENPVFASITLCDIQEIHIEAILEKYPNAENDTPKIIEIDEW